MPAVGRFNPQTGPEMGLMRWQPDYPPLQKLPRSPSKRAKRRLVVAAARRLAIDLWRWTTGRASAEKLGLALPCSKR